MDRTRQHATVDAGGNLCVTGQAEEERLPDQVARGTYLSWLLVNGYRNVRALDQQRWAATNQFMFTCAIITGKFFDTVGYDDRWCYESERKALEALEAWNGVGEPQGWHRHPKSGRRRTDGDEAQQYVAP